ncbi:unnamed protein product [Rotaria socialis]|uniref:LamG-like jellyroll fold domain-containing protein n=1 Tax=Rotaria socialis TaxID=392032 RepID=A0A820Y3P4_9BILA|nr:unnamed protein product [Rotaria socialis]CAF4540403.1 unnamed protein product [Rotaria socialis]
MGAVLNRQRSDAELQSPVLAYEATTNNRYHSIPGLTTLPYGYESRSSNFGHRFNTFARPHVSVSTVKTDSTDYHFYSRQSIIPSNGSKDILRQSFIQSNFRQSPFAIQRNIAEQWPGNRALTHSDSHLSGKQDIIVPKNSNFTANRYIRSSNFGPYSSQGYNETDKNVPTSQKTNMFNGPFSSSSSPNNRRASPNSTDIDWASAPYEYRRGQQAKKKKQTKMNRLCYCGSPLCIFATIVGAILLAAAIATPLAVLLTANKSSTTVQTCGATCLNQTWIQSTNLLAKWLFDGDFVDQTNAYNATATNSPSFTTTSYRNQALSLNSASSQHLTAPYVPLYMSSFTIEIWLYPTGYPNVLDHSIIGLCPVAAAQNCLFFAIRTNGSKHYFYFGFYSSNDILGTINVKANVWVHVAFVFNQNTLIQSIYVNGYLDTSGTALTPLLSSSGDVEIGCVQNIASTYGSNYFEGYMDELTISNRVKSSCEILEDFSFGAQFKFNSGSSLTDSGPNSLVGTDFSTSFDAGHSGESISFNGSAYFQISSVPCVAMISQAFSLALWIQPNSRVGTLAHVSTDPLGRGSCASFLGFYTNGRLAAQILNGGPPKFVLAPSLIDLSPNWTHVVQTWSSANGLRLYVNNVLVASNSSLSSYRTPFTSPVYVTLANSLTALGYCYNAAIDMANAFNGDIDDFRVYCRELSVSDICTIYNS